MGFNLLNCIAIAVHASPQQIKIFQGIARNAAGEIVYIENHRLVYEDGRHRHNQTHYMDAEGVEVAVLNANFTAHPYVPSYHFEDKRFDREDGTEVTGGEVNVYGRSLKDTSRRENTLSMSENMMTGQGLHFYISDHLEELMNPGTAKQVEFLVPLQGKSFDFRISCSAIDQARGTVTFKIEADNWFVRLFAPNLEVTYEKATKRLLSYKGISNILSPDKKVQNVVITYHYDKEFMSKAGSRL